MTAKSPYTGKVKIFADGADRASMLELSKNPIVQGLTTNPTLMKKSGIKDYKGFCQDILQNIKTKPISFEVFADDFTEMRRQALEIKGWGPNVYVKIPITNSEGVSSIGLIKDLAHQGVRLNVTAILTLNQILGTTELPTSTATNSQPSVFCERPGGPLGTREGHFGLTVGFVNNSDGR